MSLRTRILAFCIAIGLLPLALMGGISLDLASRGLEGAAFARLASVRDIQHTATEKAGRRWLADAAMFGAIKEVYNAIGMLRDYAMTEARPGVRMPVDTDAYNEVYGYVAGAFTPFVQHLGYEDALLVDDYGRILFSVKRGTDLGEDLKTGVLSGTPLAEAWQKGLKGEVVFTDFFAFGPAGGRLVAFVAAPVKSYTGDILGVAMLRVPRAALNDLMTQASGTQAMAGLSYLVGADGILRTDMSSAVDGGKPISASEEAVRAAFDGGAGERVISTSDRGGILVAFDRVQVAGATWALVCEVPAVTALAAVSRLRNTVGVLGVVTMFVAIGGALLFLRRELLRPLASIEGYVASVADGDLSGMLRGEFRGELGRLASGVNHMVAELKEKLGFAQGVLHSLTVPCVVTGRDNRVTFVNQPFIELLDLQVPPSALLGRSATEVLQGKGDGSGSTSRCLETGECVEAIEREMRDTSGHVRRVRLDAAPLNDLDGSLIGAIALIADLTVIREQEERVRSQNAMMLEVAAQAEQIATGVADETEELARQVEHGADGARQQVSCLENTGAAVRQLAELLEAAAQHADEAVNSAGEVGEKARQGTEIMERSAAAMQRMHGLSMSLSSSMHQLGEQTESIGSILGVINDIADQTNLLALNAAIEAARAGESGRGFAVVADEVRKLAERTVAATGEVRNSIRNIQETTRENLKRTEEAVDAVREGTRLVEASGAALGDIVSISMHMGEQIRSIATLSQEHERAHDAINDAVEEVRGIANATESGMRHSGGVVRDLSRSSSELLQLIARLRG